MYIDFMNTPIGRIEIRASQRGVTKVVFSESQDHSVSVSVNDIAHYCKQQLQEYFDGQRNVFDLPLDQQGSHFQKSIWDCLTEIPFGETVSYRDVARMVNNPKAVRAVGAANGKNQIGIIVPCHRVIGSNGTLTGYAGGLDRKSWLLVHEGVELKKIAPDQAFQKRG